MARGMEPTISAQPNGGGAPAAALRHRREPAAPSGECSVSRNALAVRPDQVVQLAEAGCRGLVAEGAVWSLVVVLVEPAG